MSRRTDNCCLSPSMPPRSMYKHAVQLYHRYELPAWSCCRLLCWEHCQRWTQRRHRACAAPPQLLRKLSQKLLTLLLSHKLPCQFPLSHMPPLGSAQPPVLISTQKSTQQLCLMRSVQPAAQNPVSQTSTAQSLQALAKLGCMAVLRTACAVGIAQRAALHLQQEVHKFQALALQASPRCCPFLIPAQRKA